MNKKAKITLAIVCPILIAILALGLGFGLNAKNAIDNSETSPFLSEWMSYIRDDALVKNTVIPGSHDAGTYGMMWMAETQNRTIAEQLESGSRYFDLRVWKKGGEYFVFHGPIKGAKFMPVLDEINEFLQANPSEFVILDFQKFKGDSQTDVISALSSKLGDKIVKNTTLYSDLDFIDTLTVGEARGKCIVVWGDMATLDGADFLFMRDNDKGTRQAAVLSSFYKRSLNTLASPDYIKRGLSKYIEMHENDPRGLFVLQGQLTDPVFVLGPKALEALHDKNMSEYLRTFDYSAHQLNVVMRDYIGPRKCLEILAANLAYGNVKTAQISDFRMNVSEEILGRFPA